MAVHLSKRMQTLAGLVPKGTRLVDVGTDHGYIPIYLLQESIIPSAIAMDVNEGPLQRAKEHVGICGLEDKVQLRLSDGLQKLGPNEADTCLIAGMGGGLVMKILTESAKDTLASITYFILQPQSEITEVRVFLRENDFHIMEEDMVEEDGKYYPMMLVCHADAKDFSIEEKGMAPQYLADAFGPILLEKKHPVLQEWLCKNIQNFDKIISSLEKQKEQGSMNGKTKERLEELQQKRSVFTEAKAYMEN